MAAENGHHECVSILVANGADVNGTSEVLVYVLSMGGKVGVMCNLKICIPCCHDMNRMGRQL